MRQPRPTRRAELAAKDEEVDQLIGEAGRLAGELRVTVSDVKTILQAHRRQAGEGRAAMQTRGGGDAADKAAAGEATADKVAVALAQADRLEGALTQLTGEITAVKLWKSRIGKLAIVGAVLTFLAFTAAAVGIGTNFTRAQHVKQFTECRTARNAQFQAAIRRRAELAGDGDKALTAVIEAFVRGAAHEPGSAAQLKKDADAYVKAHRDLAAVPIPAPTRGPCR
ncbi:MAG TPA: hypothetical protein VLW50_26710 [Streptosporangiaceae bacterium]|nr:hypothetical protein [Streptosporangiaceae bacterium]